MIKEVIESWNKNKDKLEKHLKETDQEKYSTYEEIVKLVVKYILQDYEYGYIKSVSFGDYQGIDLYFIPRYTYPDIEEIIFTHNYYGSCSGCDTLQMIQTESSNYGEGKPTKTQLKDYMTLCLHLVENMRYLVDSENANIK